MCAHSSGHYNLDVVQLILPNMQKNTVWYLLYFSGVLERIIWNNLFCMVDMWRCIWYYALGVWYFCVCPRFPQKRKTLGWPDACHLWSPHTIPSQALRYRIWHRFVNFKIWLKEKTAPCGCKITKIQNTLLTCQSPPLYRGKAPRD